MATEDQDILTKISLLAGKFRHAHLNTRNLTFCCVQGQINRHKTEQLGDQYSKLKPTSSRFHGSVDQNLRSHRNGSGEAPGFQQLNNRWQPSRGAYSPTAYSRGARPPQTHRNRTLVLNGTNLKTNPGGANLDDTSTAELAENAKPGWVSKTDRHLQLINTSIYEKDSQTRVRAIEETRKQKLLQRDERERLKIAKHLQRLSKSTTIPKAELSQTQHGGGSYEINVQGIRFSVAKNGSKLVKIAGEVLRHNPLDEAWGLKLDSPYSGDNNAIKASPKIAVVGGVKFYRSKNGNMYRSGIIKAHRRSGVVKKIDELCKTFTTTGSCSKVRTCRYLHDPAKVALCKTFIHKGSCPSGDSCDLSHDPTPERTPTCVHFSKGNCSNPSCCYSHVHVSPTALVCHQFGIYGYCEKGASCLERHVHECPEFSNTGKCTSKGCKLPHRHKASLMRSNAAARGESSAEDESSDVSSDEEDDEIDSDDIDSDDLDDEILGGGEEADEDIPMQKDFVQLS